MRATAGDFLDEADNRLRQARASVRPAAGNPEIGSAAQGLRRLADALVSHLRDVFPGDGMSERASRQLGGHVRASVVARRLIARASSKLEQASLVAAEGPSARTRDLGRNLEASAAAVTAARDLLETHFAIGPDGALERISEWAPVISSGPVRRAILSKVGAYCQQAASVSALLAQASSSRRAGPARRYLLEACEDLWACEEAIHAAALREPAGAAGHALLAAIPLYMLSARVAPTPVEAVTGLCAAVIGSAERLRQLTWRHPIALERLALAPEASAASLRQCAAAATVTSYACGAALELLRTRAGQLRQRPASQALARPLAAVPAANRGWMDTAAAVGQLRSDTRGDLTEAASAALDLATWAGRLVFTDVDWTPARGRSQHARAPDALAPTTGDLVAVVAAVHHASHTLSRLAASEAARAAATMTAGRLYVPRRSVPDPDLEEARAHLRHLLASGVPKYRIASMNGPSPPTVSRLTRPGPLDTSVKPSTVEKILRLQADLDGHRAFARALPYVPVPAEQARALLATYRSASQASEQLAAGMDAAAWTIGAPTAILTAARLACAERAAGEIETAVEPVLALGALRSPRDLAWADVRLGSQFPGLAAEAEITP